MHVIPSASDADAGTEKSPGERHGLAVQALSLPLTHMTTFAPRDRQEAAVASSIINEGAAYQSLDASGACIPANYPR